VSGRIGTDPRDLTKLHRNRTTNMRFSIMLNNNHNAENN